MSGTGIPRVVVSAYATSGTDLLRMLLPGRPYGRTKCGSALSVLHLPIVLRACYVMPGTDLAYATTRIESRVAKVAPYAHAVRCPVLTSGMILRTCYGTSSVGAGWSRVRAPTRDQGPRSGALDPRP
eukprot:766801-Rhodomonas_salina.3